MNQKNKKERIIPEFSSGSSTYVVMPWKSLSDGQQVQGLSNKNDSGFTLLEILVVVLIIGVLAAIAVPQYQKVVKKIKYERILPLMNSIITAQRAYYLSNGSYATSFDVLDMAIPRSGKESSKCGGVGWEYDTRYKDGLCVVITKAPALGVRITIPPKEAWRYYSNGYHYLFNSYQNATPGLYCYECATGNRDPHCTGTIRVDNAFGIYYAM